MVAEGQDKIWKMDNSELVLAYADEYACPQTMLLLRTQQGAFNSSGAGGFGPAPPRLTTCSGRAFTQCGWCIAEARPSVTLLGQVWAQGIGSRACSARASVLNGVCVWLGR